MPPIVIPILSVMAHKHATWTAVVACALVIVAESEMSERVGRAKENAYRHKQQCSISDEEFLELGAVREELALLTESACATYLAQLSEAPNVQARKAFCEALDHIRARLERLPSGIVAPPPTTST